MSREPTPDYALLDRAGATGQMFYPRPELYPPPAGAADHAIEVEPGVHVSARFYLLDRSRPTLLYFHGNGEIASDHDGIAPLYHEAGINLFVAEFRGYGNSNGSPSLANLVGDAHAVLAYFHTLLDGQSFSGARCVMGRSLGSHPALELAANGAERLSGLIIESGAASMGRMLERAGLDGTSEGDALGTAHEAKIRSIRLPALIIHGEQDELIPLSRAAELYELLEATERTRVTIPNAGHNDLLYVGQQQYFDAIHQFVAGQ